MSMIFDLEAMGYFVEADAEGAIRAVTKRGFELRDPSLEELRRLLKGERIEVMPSKRD